MPEIKSVIWEVTSRCNLNCIHCSSAAGNKNKNELNLDEALGIIDQLYDIGITTIKFSGGEPLLRPNFKQIMEYAQIKDFNTILFTNGLLLNKEILKELLVDYVQVGLDTINARFYGRYRGKNHLDDVLRGINNSINFGFPTGVAITVSGLNFFHYQKTFDFLSSWDIEGVCLSRFVPSGRGKENADRLLLSSIQRKQLIIFAKNVIKSEKLSMPIFLDDPLISLTEPLAIKGEKCTAGEEKITIASDGEVFPCPLLRIPVGNIRTKPIDKILQESILIRNIRKRELKGKCGKCKFRFKCGGCRAMAYYATGDPFETDPDCWVY